MLNGSYSAAVTGFSTPPNHATTDRLKKTTRKVKYDNLVKWKTRLGNEYNKM